MLIKKGRFYYYYLENQEIVQEINNWITPFGLEKFLKKSIINLTVPDNNEGLNIINLLTQIQEEIFKEKGEYSKSPLNDNGKNKLLRCQVSKESSLNLNPEKNDTVSGTIRFQIYDFRGNWGISAII